VSTLRNPESFTEFGPARAAKSQGTSMNIVTPIVRDPNQEQFDTRRLLAHAQQQGANAVIGVRYDATEIMNGVTEVLCYGTAVTVERA